MNIIAKQVLSLWGFLILGIFPLFGQSTPIKALPPENITATSFEVRASATLPFSPPGYVFDVAYDSTFAESSFVPGFDDGVHFCFFLKLPHSFQSLIRQRPIIFVLWK
jgi:hypothetical protein